MALEIESSANRRQPISPVSNRDIQLDSIENENSTKIRKQLILGVQASGINNKIRLH